jgi:transcriptional regulator with GAF, ATPase, and Fis domain
MPGVHGSQGAAETTVSMATTAFAASAQGQEGDAGLVLLYAPEYEKLAPAYAFRRQEVTIGRDPDATIRIPQAAVSRQHARIERQGDGWLLVDLGGRNGSLVNGRFVREVVLKPLDEIRVGDAVFKFVGRDAAGYAHHRIDGAFLADPSTGEVSGQHFTGRIVGGYQIQSIAAALRKVARSDLSVVILGETGTGKEVFARQLHDWSGRRGAFQAVNCAAIPAALIEGELFGHRRGAFSGADRDRTGLVRAAHGGTLFLDEIGDLPLEAQAKLLRVLQSREVTPLGATQPEPVDVRFVCATHRDLDLLQQRGGFRHDLFARLNEYSLTLPPLRERKEDLFGLCQGLCARHGRPDPHITFPFMAALLHYSFPYNVRELEALVKRWVAVAPRDVLDEEALSDEIKDQMTAYAVAHSGGAISTNVPIETNEADSVNVPSSPSPSSTQAPKARKRGEAPTEQELRGLLAEHKGNVAAIGRLFRRDRVQVHRWMKRYGIDVDEYR